MLYEESKSATIKKLASTYYQEKLEDSKRKKKGEENGHLRPGHEGQKEISPYREELSVGKVQHAR